VQARTGRRKTPLSDVTPSDRRSSSPTGAVEYGLKDKRPGGRPLTRQGIRTRGALLRAARRVFEQKGYHNTRIADITAEARASVGTYYTYFESKEEVFRHLLVQIEDEVYGELTLHPPLDRAPHARIRETNRLYFESFQRNARFWAVVEEASLFSAEARRVLKERHQYYRSRTRRALAAWSDHGLIDSDLDVDFASTALGAMTERCAYLWFVYDEPVDLERAVDQITTLWLKALGMSSEEEPPHSADHET
jgi:AcrR family transcriptional regulator